MFLLGAGFMLIETKAVVHMALLFGSTWVVAAVVFLAVLVMILAANLFVLRFRPQQLRLSYAGLLGALILNLLIPLDSLLGLPRGLQECLACLLVFAPVFFACVIFAVSLERSSEPSHALGVNIAGAMAGGLAEYLSMLLGFHGLVYVAIAFYVLSAVTQSLPRLGVKNTDSFLSRIPTLIEKRIRKSSQVAALKGFAPSISRFVSLAHFLRGVSVTSRNESSEIQLP